MRDWPHSGQRSFKARAKKRHALGVSPIPTSPAAALPEAVHVDYESAIRDAAHHVGKLCLEASNIPAANIIQPGMYSGRAPSSGGCQMMLTMALMIGAPAKTSGAT